MNLSEHWAFRSPPKVRAEILCIYFYYRKNKYFKMNYVIISLIHDLREQSSPLLPTLRKCVTSARGL